MKLLRIGILYGDNLISGMAYNVCRHVNVFNSHVHSCSNIFQLIRARFQIDGYTCQLDIDKVIDIYIQSTFWRKNGRSKYNQRININ